MDIQHRIGGAPGVPQFKVGLVTAARKRQVASSAFFAVASGNGEESEFGVT